MADTEHTLQEIVFLEDLMKLSKISIQEICTTLNLSDNGLVEDLISSIWDKISKDKDLKIYVLEPYVNKVFCSKTSSSWFEFIEKDEQQELSDDKVDNLQRETVREKIIKYAGFNPFKEIHVPKDKNISTKPTIIGAANRNDSEYIVRFMYNIGTQKSFLGNQIHYIPKIKLVTVLINEKYKVVEVRGDATCVKKVSKEIGKIIEKSYALEEIKLKNKFNGNINEISSILNGEILNTSSITAEEKSLTIEESNSVAEILNVVNQYINNDIDTNDFIDRMENIKKLNEEFFENNNFISSLLVGLVSVGLRANKDLMEQPLYKLLQPYTISSEGSIIFKFNEEGMINTYTIHVTFTTNSIRLSSFATEALFSFIREKLIYK